MLVKMPFCALGDKPQIQPLEYCLTKLFVALMLQFVETMNMVPLALSGIRRSTSAFLGIRQNLRLRTGVVPSFPSCLRSIHTVSSGECFGCMTLVLPVSRHILGSTRVESWPNIVPALAGRTLPFLRRREVPWLPVLPVCIA